MSVYFRILQSYPRRVMDIDSVKGISSSNRKEKIEHESALADENGVTEEMEVSGESEKKAEDQVEIGQGRENGATEHSDNDNEDSVDEIDQSKEDLSGGEDGAVTSENDEEDMNQQEGSAESVGTFMGALNLLPAKRSVQEMDEENCDEKDEEQKGSPQKSPEHAKTLTELFKEDPEKIVRLLGAALSMDSLSSILKSEKKNLSENCTQMKEKLKKAQKTLSDCSQQKDSILHQIDEVGEQIQVKRRQLEDTRDELKHLSSQEAEVKTRRDTAYRKASELQRKMHACRDLVQQIQQLYPASSSSGSSSGGGLGKTAA